MSSFSERFGLVPPRIDLQPSDMPQTLVDGLWDTTSIFFFSEIHGRSGGGDYSVDFHIATRKIWFNFFRESIDGIPRYPGPAREIVRQRFMDSIYFRRYEFIEFIIKEICPAPKLYDYREALNKVLSRERAAFRVIDQEFVMITSEGEIAEIERSVASPSSGVREHIITAAKLYSRMPTPDYRNSVKESISAVESAVAFVTGGAPAGVSKPLKDAIKKFRIHPSMAQGFEKLYAYTNDSSGIRHAITEGSEPVTQEDARYMLVSCSAFANYLLSKAAAASVEA